MHNHIITYLYNDILSFLFSSPGPVKRVNKRYIDDPSIEIPYSTRARWNVTSETNQHAAAQAEDEDVHMQERPDSASDITLTNEDGPECDDNDNAQTGDNNYIPGSDSPESDSAESDGSQNDTDSSQSDTDSSSSDSEGGSDDQSVQHPLSVQESQALSILSCFLRHNMSASACKDVLKTMKNLFPGSEAVHVLDYDRIWSTMAGSELHLKESHYCPMCCEVYPDNEDVFNCGTEGCEGLRYKGPRSNQMGKGRQPRQSFAFADTKKQLQHLLESPGMYFCI